MALVVAVGYVPRFNFVFFSSRRRHTRCGRDWSSDVCSSDLCDQLSRGWGTLVGLAGKCMRASGSTPGSAVLLAACNQADDAQVWTKLPSGEIKNLLGGGLC